MSRRKSVGLPPDKSPMLLKGFPLLDALIATLRGVPRAAETYQYHRERIDKLNDPQTVWDERKRLLDELEKEGWDKFEIWPVLKRQWKFAGEEWRMPFTQAQWEELEAIRSERPKEKKAFEGWRQRWYSTLAGYTKTWLNTRPELKRRILDDTESLHFFIVWIACQQWAQEEDFGRWLMEQIVKGEIRRLRPTPASGFTKDDLSQEGFTHLLLRIQQGVRYVDERLSKYWARCVRNHLLRELEWTRSRSGRNVRTDDSETEEGRQDWLKLKRRKARPQSVAHDSPPASLTEVIGDFRNLEAHVEAEAEEAIEDVADASTVMEGTAEERIVETLRRCLQTRGKTGGTGIKVLMALQDMTMRHKKAPSAAEISREAGIPLRTVERRLAEVRKLAARLREE